MTKKDYELIASVFHLEITTTQSRHTKVLEALTSTAVRLASQLQADNPRFDRQRFLTACGV